MKAFVFPGQGAQLIGMGKDLYEKYDEAKKLYDRANEILDMDISKICFDGPKEDLDLTPNCQPAILLTSCACLEVLKNNNADFNPDFVAGLSLGEYTALVAAGSISFEDALRTVRKRGQLMQEAADQNPGGMASVIGLKREACEELLKECVGDDILVLANFNCPGQVVFSGHHAAVDRVVEQAKGKGARMAVKLAVSGAFHSPLMQPAADGLAAVLQGVEIKRPNVKFVPNYTAEYLDDPEAIKGSLVNQLTGSVRWEDSMNLLLSDGLEQIFEIGPGKVLSGLMKRINRKTGMICLGTVENFDKLSEV